jgi:GNAT superfamily N-acetyltransferase
MMAHRLVILPDWQGLGLGWRFSEWMGELLTRHGYRYHYVTSHPALVAAFDRSPRWAPQKKATLHAGASAHGGMRRAALQLRRLGTHGYVYRPAIREHDKRIWLEMVEPESAPYLPWSKTARRPKLPDEVGGSKRPRAR